MKIEIKHRWNGSVLFSFETTSVRIALEAAIKQGANLRSANLEGADLEGADLVGANLEGANLRSADLVGADLVGADLEGADLVGADLEGADLVGANLVGANLRSADLVGADLVGADLEGADLVGADLVGANLRSADLRTVRDDLWAVLSAAPGEVAGFRQALIEGRIDGSTYSGDCACLVGTIANVRGCKYNELPVLKPDSSRPAERFFLGIKRGDTPETNQFSKLALEWTDQWLSNVRSAFEVKA